MKKSDIYKIIFVSYGLDNFDKGLFKEPTFDLDINKPRGGFWGSPINSDSSWGEWCKNNEYNIKSLDKHILFKVKKGSKICIIDDERDLKGHSINIPRYYYRRDDMIQDLKSRYPNAHRYEIENAVDDYLKRDSKSVLDFDFLKRYYDGIFVSANAVHKLRHVSNGDGLYWWDVESICIFNPDVIEIIPENAFEKATI